MPSKITPLEADNGWTFNFTDFNAEEYEKLNEHIRAAAVTPLIPILAKIVVTCPHGDPTDTHMWKSLNAIEFLTIGGIIGEALSAEVKKLSALRSSR
jgi:hypothetical protein